MGISEKEFVNHFLAIHGSPGAFHISCLHSNFYLYILMLVPSANSEGETIANA
jgi:hypothetical protein